MDSSLQQITSSASTHGKHSSIILSEREKFLATYCRNQPWSLPDPLIYYISKNPSTSKVYKKLVQSCKYFFIQNSLLIASDLNIKYEKNQWNISLNEKNVDLNCVSSKLWITDKLLRLENDTSIPSNSLPIVLTKIYQSDVKELIMNRYQKIYFTDLQLLAFKCEAIALFDTEVINADGSVTNLEKIIEMFPKIKHYFYNFAFNFVGASVNHITPETVKNLIQIPHFSNLLYFSVFNISEAFDIDTFYNYIKKNKKTCFVITFVSQLSQEYRNRLQTIVNKIIATKNRKYRVPMISFSGIDASSHKTLNKLSSRF